MKNALNKFIVGPQATIGEAYRKMLLNKKNIIFICQPNREIIGIVTDGDFKRAFWSNIDQKNSILSIGKKKIFCFINSNELKKKRIFPSNVNHVPVLRKNKIIKIIFEFNKKNLNKNYKTNKFSLVILAGGYGKRLLPITKFIPKALVSIKNKTILEIIISKFNKYKVEKIFLALFHKKKLIKSFIKSKKIKKIKILEEKKQTGTAGPLAQINFNEEKFPIIVTNCDIILNYNYNEILKFHREKNNKLTIVGFLDEQNINYGVCKVTNKGELISLIEKPKIKYIVNCGFYIVSPEIIQYIKKNVFLDMDKFIKKIIKKNLKIGVYPIPKESYKDIGTLEKYKKLINNN